MLYTQYTINKTYWTFHIPSFTLRMTQLSLHINVRWTHYIYHEVHYTLALDITNYLLHTMFWTLHTTQYTLEITHYTLHTMSWTLPTTHYSLNTTHYTIHTTDYTLYSGHYTLHITPWKPHSRLPSGPFPTQLSTAWALGRKETSQSHRDSSSI